jgi:hypothetical protein
MTRTKKQLENTLLDRTVKRFRKTKLNKIQPSRKDEDTKEYFIEKNGFKFRLYLDEDLKDGHLWVLNSKGYIFESFDLSDKKYAPVIKNIYEEIRKRVIKQKEKENQRVEREFNRNLKRLDRLL